MALRIRFFVPVVNFVFVILLISLLDKAVCIRVVNQISDTVVDSPDRHLKSAVFALGSFWRSEAVFGCINGVVRTTVGYAGGTKTNPEYRNLGDHAESVQVEYDPSIIGYRQLLDVFWSSHDSRQVFGQGPDVGNQYRSCIFTYSSKELRLASTSKEREQLRSRSSIVTTQIQQLATFYRAEPDHQKFELKQHPFLIQLIGNMPEDELERSTLATKKLNGYAAELCPPRIQKQIDSRVNEIIRKGWPCKHNTQDDHEKKQEDSCFSTHPMLLGFCVLPMLLCFPLYFNVSHASMFPFVMLGLGYKYGHCCNHSSNLM